LRKTAIFTPSAPQAWLGVIELAPTLLIGNEKYFLITPIYDPAQCCVTDYCWNKPLEISLVHQDCKNQRNDSNEYTKSLPVFCVGVDREFFTTIRADPVIFKDTWVAKLPYANFNITVWTSFHREST
jgi:hypothetical protein